MEAIWKQPVRDASAWLGSDLGSSADWAVTLSGSEIAEAREYIERTEGLPLGAPADFASAPPIAGLDRIVDSMSWALKDGRGIALVKGWPVEGIAGAQRLFWVIGRRLGTP